MALYTKGEFCKWCLHYKANRSGSYCTCFGSEVRLQNRKEVPDWCPYKDDVEEFRKIENFPDNLLRDLFAAC